MEQSTLEPEVSSGRRELLKAIAGAAGVVGARLLLPALWTAPIVASMPLPAHAALSPGDCSGVSLDPPSGSVLVDASLGSVSGGRGAPGTMSTSTITLTIRVPEAWLTAKMPYQLYERVTKSGSDVAAGVCVIKLFVPTGNVAEFRTTSITLTRSESVGKYAYQLRTSGAHTEWFNVF